MNVSLAGCAKVCGVERDSHRAAQQFDQDLDTRRRVEVTLENCVEHAERTPFDYHRLTGTKAGTGPPTHPADGQPPAKAVHDILIDGSRRSVGL
jgi:hypothetical protein